MVSLWPWKATDSTTSFEKNLAAVSGKISKANVSRDLLVSRSRRLKALWTIYTSLTYIFCTLILVLVTGWKNWGPIEYSVVVGGPLLIYGVRTAVSAYYNYRLSKTQLYLNELNKQRESEIEKFKTATKYNTTQQLLEKYGAAPQSSSTARGPAVSTTKNQSGNNNGSTRFRPTRTNIPPPPTANIRRPETITSTPEPSPGVLPGRAPSSVMRQELSPSEEFAPNAFSAPPQYSAPAYGSSQRHKWYDRILDVILGEDEGRPSNRLALICSQCRLVNGQAPPGMKTLEEVGKWRCSSCGALNGEDTTARKIIDATGLGNDSPAHASPSPGANEQLHREHKSRIPEMEQKSKIDGGFDGAEDGDSVLDEDSISFMSEADARAEDAENRSESESLRDTPPARSTRSQSKRTKRT